MLAILVLYGALTPAVGQTGVNAEQILAAYTRAQDEIHGLVVHFASEWHAEHNMTHVPTRCVGSRVEYGDGWLVQDFALMRTVHRQDKWGQLVIGARHFSRADPVYSIRRWAGGEYLQYDSTSPFGIIARTPRDASFCWRNPLLYFVEGTHGPWTLGYFCQDQRRLDRRLAGASLTLRPLMERVGEARCYVIEANTRCGYITAWFDPEKQYALARCVLELTADDIYHQESTLAAAFKIPGTTAREEMVVDAFRQVDGRWLASRTRAWHNVWFPSGDYHRHLFVVALDSWRVNPDFDAVGAFDMTDIPDDSLWRYADIPMQNYLWNRGNLAPTRISDMRHAPSHRPPKWRPTN